ncbi:b1.1 [Ichnoviriform fugitivi]|uniref:B1.1 n=1 Tax=Ichnoviriform fugitivi TaxID=265522 RepID=Q5BMB2_9VIRU|nr:b1.1 [Ichnoviriform fugitivi]AAX24121.1 b1.1 [Ichnoviriform fugitivi]
MTSVMISSSHSRRRTLWFRCIFQMLFWFQFQDYLVTWGVLPIGPCQFAKSCRVPEPSLFIIPITRFGIYVICSSLHLRRGWEESVRTDFKIGCRLNTPLLIYPAICKQFFEARTEHVG